MWVCGNRKAEFARIRPSLYTCGDEFFEETMTSTNFFPPADASDALSSWVLKPEACLTHFRESGVSALEGFAEGNTLVTFVARGIFERIAMFAIVVPTAPMDCIYHFVWLIFKTVTVSSRTAVRLITHDEYGYYALYVTKKDLGVHAYKCIAFGVASLGGWLLALSNPSVLVARYKEHDLILCPKKKEGWEAVKEKIDTYRESLNQKIDATKQLMLKHRVKLLAGISIITLSCVLLPFWQKK
jgi:hypothetical protein